MSFAELRQTVLQGYALSTDYFAEDVEMGAPDDSGELLSVRVKIDTLYETRRGLGSNPANEARRGTLDERQRIKVTLSRDASWSRAYPGRPQLGTPLYRAEARDADRRPYTFRGEVAYEGDQHAVYVFERPRRVTQGAGN